MNEERNVEKIPEPEDIKKETGSGGQAIEAVDKQAEAEAYLFELTQRRRKKPRNGMDLFWKAIIFGLLGGLIVAVSYLFILRDSDSADEYLHYFGGMVTAIETFKGNSDAILDRSFELIRRGMNDETGETYLKEKEEFFQVITGNISACEYAKKEIDKVLVPYKAERARKDIINFFNEAEKCMRELEKAISENSTEKFESVKSKIEELKKVKISGYVYID
ncbi:MAG TPA: hypothetical protein PKK26_19305 [Candidatus Wallbacteria bacterium]|nr:hypothetical protein [Candidatus Wallbacteria bacterium]